jgi:hypothetical protein
LIPENHLLVLRVSRGVREGKVAFLWPFLNATCGYSNKKEWVFLSWLHLVKRDKGLGRYIPATQEAEVGG